MSVIGLCVDYHLFPSDLMLDFVYAMIIISEHKKYAQQGGREVEGMIINTSCFC